MDLFAIGDGMWSMGPASSWRSWTLAALVDRPEETDIDDRSPPCRTAVEKPQTRCYVWREGVILVESPLRKLLWMVVAIAAMALLAPLTASAHEGHPTRQPIVHVASHHQHAAAHVDPVQVGSSVQEAAAQPEGAGALDHDGLCTAGCCYGMGCCGVTILSAAPALDPPAGAPALVDHTPPPLSSAGLTSLLEPPTTLA